MHRYLVVSYDTDQQQWFYDTVLAENTDAAKGWVCKVREYVVDADVLTVEEVSAMAQRLATRTDEQVQAMMDLTVAENTR